MSDVISLASDANMNDSYSDPQFFAPKLAGPHYIKFVDVLHKCLNPKAYLEIGVRHGRSFELARCPSIGIDPAFKEMPGVCIENKTASLMFRISSDEFFANYDPVKLLGRKIDIAFLDGMHWFEYLLRDFINTERSCRNNSIIMLHDCVPTDISMVRRDENGKGVTHRRPGSGWAGDVWKIMPVLKKYRPNISITALDCAPTGLVLLTNLDSENEVLSRNYFEILEFARSLNLAKIGVAPYLESIGVQSTRDLMSHDALSQRFSF